MALQNSPHTQITSILEKSWTPLMLWLKKTTSCSVVNLNYYKNDCQISKVLWRISTRYYFAYIKRKESFINPLFVIVALYKVYCQKQMKNILRKFSKPQGGFLLISRRIGATCDIISTFHNKKSICSVKVNGIIIRNK